MKNILLLLFISLFTIGCSQKLGTFTIISTKKVDLNENYKKSKKKIIHQDISKAYFIFSPKAMTIGEGITNTLKDNCAEYLTDVDVSFSYVFIPLIYTEFKLITKGYTWSNKNKLPCKE